MKKITIIIEDGEMDITESPKCQYPVTKDKFLYRRDSACDRWSTDQVSEPYTTSSSLSFRDIPGYAEMQKDQASEPFLFRLRNIHGNSEIPEDYWEKLCS